MITCLGVNLPAGWSYEEPEHMPGCVVLRSGAANCGWITIDLRHRIYDIGVGIPRKWDYNRISTKTYTGRDWKKRLVADAIAHLQEVLR